MSTKSLSGFCAGTNRQGKSTRAPVIVWGRSDYPPIKRREERMDTTHAIKPIIPTAIAILPRSFFLALLPLALCGRGCIVGCVVNRVLSNSKTKWHGYVAS